MCIHSFCLVPSPIENGSASFKSRQRCIASHSLDCQVNGHLGLHVPLQSEKKIHTHTHTASRKIPWFSRQNTVKLRSKRKYIPTHSSPFILDVVVVCVCVCAGARPLCLTESQDKQKVLAALVSSTSRFLKKKQEEVIDGGGGQPMYRSNRAVHRHCCALPFQLRGQNNFLQRILPFSPPSSLVSVSSSSSCVVWLFFFFFFFAKQFPPPLLGRLRGGVVGSSFSPLPSANL